MKSLQNLSEDFYKKLTELAKHHAYLIFRKLRNYHFGDYTFESKYDWEDLTQQIILTVLERIREKGLDKDLSYVVRWARDKVLRELKEKLKDEDFATFSYREDIRNTAEEDMWE